jgi:hypothetical protein
MYVTESTNHLDAWLPHFLETELAWINDWRSAASIKPDKIDGRMVKSRPPVTPREKPSKGPLSNEINSGRKALSPRRLFALRKVLSDFLEYAEAVPNIPKADHDLVDHPLVQLLL